MVAPPLGRTGNWRPAARGFVKYWERVIRLLFFSLHVQVGVEDRNLAVDTMNVSRYMLPHILAVSTSWSRRRMRGFSMEPCWASTPVGEEEGGSSV